jgi:DNA modification methylase
MMSRTGSFPLSLALSLVDRHSLPGETVLDPFCGKGTTLLAARLLGRKAFGMDVAPEAVICTAAKLSAVTL